MEGMKGFYFSLDALTASMVLLAVVGMLASYSPRPEEPQKPFELDYLHTASMQNTSDWNVSKDSDRTVLSEIYYQYYSGNQGEADNICNQYFNFSKSYGLYFSNTTERDKICGNLNPSRESNLETEQTTVPDIKINDSFIGPKTAVMVVNN